METIERQKILDEERLRLLSLFHYISGGMSIGFSCIFIFHFIFLLLISTNPDMFNNGRNPDLHGPPIMVFKVFAVIFGSFIILGITYGILEIISGRFITKRKHRLFSFIVALPRVLFIPYGCILSIFTLILLEKSSVKALYDDAKRSTLAQTVTETDPSVRNKSED